MDYQHIALEPMEGALGVEITAPALFADNDPHQADAIAEVYRAWLDYHLIVFRDLDMTPHALAQFCAQFGELDTYPFVEATTEHPNVITIVKEPEQTKRFQVKEETRCSPIPVWPMRPCLQMCAQEWRG